VIINKILHVDIIIII